MLFLVLLLCSLVTAVTAQNPSTEGFISIDCGLSSTAPYRDPVNGLLFSPDEPYTSTGVNREVSAEANITGLKSYYRNVRSFPEGVRNCYTLPVRSGGKYRINGEFKYGNYDGLQRPPTFDLYLDVNPWTTVQAEEYVKKEIISLATADSMDVSLVSTGQGTPFISALLLRPVPFDMYSEANSTQFLVMNNARINFGGEKQIAFPADAYDRRWIPDTDGVVITTTSTVRQPQKNGIDFTLPPDVLNTAIAAPSPSDSLNFSISGLPEQKTYVHIYIAELQELASNDTREFIVYAGETVFVENYRPVYLEGDVLYTKSGGLTGGMTYFIRPTKNSTLPPIINAVEGFIAQEIILRPTNQIEVQATSELKRSYGVVKNWQGDPCLPTNFIWDGIKCSTNATNFTSISSLDLSRSNLSGGIPPSIANLTALTSLDLSNNNLSGEIPAFMGQLPLLKLLNLEGNNLSGTLPDSLTKRLQDGSLKLRIGNNPILCSNVNVCTVSSAMKGNIIIPIAIAVSVAVLLIGVIVTVFIFRRLKSEMKKKNSQEESQKIEPVRKGASAFLESGNPNGGGSGFVSESHRFSSSEIASITNNFERPIGKGGFGVVYHGQVKDGTEVAVKVLSVSSAQGEKQFITEAQLLTRVHHKNLVSLLGFCNENLALVYEFVPLGSLSNHLSGDTEAGSKLTWRRRVRIALEAAQGLEYLHNGCQPPIVHRDVKTSNILLTEKFEVKLADFGLSRFINEDASHISTIVAGTPGYLDPDYYQTNRLNEKSDIYSFGVVLLELVTGSPPISNDTNRTHITKKVMAMIERGDISKIIDARMNGHYDTASAWKVIEIALSCTSLNSDHRPTISGVVVHLKECQAVEHSKEFYSDATSDSSSTIPHYAMPDITPSAR